MIQSQQVLEWQAEARTAEWAEAVFTVLETRFGALPADMAARVREMIDLAILKRWLETAARVATLDEFRQIANV